MSKPFSHVVYEVNEQLKSNPIFHNIEKYNDTLYFEVLFPHVAYVCAIGFRYLYDNQKDSIVLKDNYTGAFQYEFESGKMNHDDYISQCGFTMDMILKAAKKLFKIEEERFLRYSELK